ncbi:major capsid protein [Escherichia coli]|nr:major capsid protein [Escherichia coli]
MMNNNSLFAIRLLKDTEGNYLWRPGLELGQPSSLAGYGIAENEQMPDIAADAKAIAFGNFKRGYTIVDRIGTRILRDPYTNKPFVGFLYHQAHRRHAGRFAGHQTAEDCSGVIIHGRGTAPPVLTGEES